MYGIWSTKVALKNSKKFCLKIRIETNNESELMKLCMGLNSVPLASKKFQWRLFLNILDFMF